MLKNVQSKAFIVAFTLLFACLAQDAYSQQAKIEGRVLDETGFGLPGASVLIMGTSIGSVTDLDGYFQLEVDNVDSAVLRVSFIGYTTQEIAVNDQTTFTITLQQDMQSLSEVVIVGYGEQKKATLTGS